MGGCSSLGGRKPGLRTNLAPEVPRLSRHFSGFGTDLRQPPPPGPCIKARLRHSATTYQLVACLINLLVPLEVSMYLRPSIERFNGIVTPVAA